MKCYEPIEAQYLYIGYLDVICLVGLFHILKPVFDYLKARSIRAKKEEVDY